MLNIGNGKKIIIIILIILIALVAMSVVSLFVADALTRQYSAITIAAKSAGIDKVQAFQIIDAIEDNYDNIEKILTTYIDDSMQLLISEDDVLALESILSVLPDNITSEQLATFIYTLENPSHNRVDTFFSLFDYADFDKIGKIKDYDIVTKLPDLMAKLPQHDDSTITDPNLSKEEFMSVTSNIYTMIDNIKSADMDSKLRAVNTIKNISKATNVAYEVPIDDMCRLCDLMGDILKGVTNYEPSLMAIKAYLFYDENEVMNVLAKCPNLIENIVYVLDNTTDTELIYHIGGEYPNMERVLDMICYTIKTKIPDKNNIPVVAKEFTYLATNTFDKEKFLNEDMVFSLIMDSVNLDKHAFTSEQEKLWNDVTYHFIDKLPE